MTPTKVMTPAKAKTDVKPAADPAEPDTKVDHQVVSDATSTQVKEAGLCVTCRHAPRCLFYKAARQAIWFCDEFDDTQGEGKTSTSTPMPKNYLDEQPHDLEQGPPPSLCVNCENRMTCMNRKPGETVLECEDYC
jgi:hypothetical protein